MGNVFTTNNINVIAYKFNSFIVNVGTVLAISPTDNNLVDYTQQDIITNIYFDPATENEVRKTNIFRSELKIANGVQNINLGINGVFKLQTCISIACIFKIIDEICA